MSIREIEQIPTALMIQLSLTTQLHQQLKASGMRAEEAVSFTRNILKEGK